MQRWEGEHNGHDPVHVPWIKSPSALNSSLIEWTSVKSKLRGETGPGNPNAFRVIDGLGLKGFKASKQVAVLRIKD